MFLVKPKWNIVKLKVMLKMIESKQLTHSLTWIPHIVPLIELLMETRDGYQQDRYKYTFTINKSLHVMGQDNNEVHANLTSDTKMER